MRQLGDAARGRVLGLGRVSRSAESNLVGLAGLVAVAPIPRHLVRPEEEVDAHRLDVGAAVRCSAGKVLARA